MNGIVSLLDPPAYAQVESIWQVLETECGLSGIKMTPLPHFSWQIAEDYDLEPIRKILEQFAQQTRPFPALASGLGIFTGSAPVLYIPVVKDDLLLRFHARLWEEIRANVAGSSSYYSPQAWMPHITLAYGDVDSRKLICAVETLALKTINLQLRVDNLALVYQVEDREGWLKYRFDFQK